MEYIGNRISIQRKDNELSIVILSLRDKTKNMMLVVWLLLWSISGVLVISQYFTNEDANVKTTIIVWMGFWAYFEYKILMAYRWRKNGAEKIKIKEGVLTYKKDVGGKGKSKEFKIEAIKNLKILEVEDNSFWDNINDSYWVIAGEKIAFDYYGAEVKFGMQLTNEESLALLKLLRNKLSK